MEKKFDVIVIGGGQSGLAVGYYLRRTDLNYLILDGEQSAGGSWLHAWKSLRLFSPAQWSSLPGTLMQGGPDYYPTRDETIAYLQAYEHKYQLNILRPVNVNHVKKSQQVFLLETTEGTFQTKVLVSATGNFRHPFIPDLTGKAEYKGKIIHSSQYISPEEFSGQRIAVVGEGNSGAQILAEISKVATTFWISKNKPRFLPDDIDGRYLFDAATRMYEAKKQGIDFKPPSLGDIVMVPPVKDARARGVLTSLPPFREFYSEGLLWDDGHKEAVQAVIFCTGFYPALAHLEPLGLINKNLKVDTEETKSNNKEGLWLVGYGNWTGFASATLIGVGRSARKTVEEIQHYLQNKR